MWMLFARAPPPDLPYWYGRCWLAAADAVAWPCALVLAVRAAPVDLGVVGGLACAWAVAAALRRLWTAIRCNHRYRFTTWRWAKALAWLLIVGTVLKLAS